MADNKDLWRVADGIIDAKEYTRETLSSVDMVMSYAAEGCDIDISEAEAMHIIAQCNAWLAKNDGNWSKNWEELKKTIIDWERDYLQAGKYELINENSNFSCFDRLMERKPLDDFQIEQLIENDRMNCGNVDGETTAEYMNLKNGHKFSIRQESPNDLTLYVKQIG